MIGLPLKDMMIAAAHKYHFASLLHLGDTSLISRATSFREIGLPEVRDYWTSRLGFFRIYGRKWKFRQK